MNPCMVSHCRNDKAEPAALYYASSMAVLFKFTLICPHPRYDVDFFQHRYVVEPQVDYELGCPGSIQVRFFPNAERDQAKAAFAINEAT